MISGNFDNITAPVRNIGAKVEVIKTSTETLQGKAVRMNGCAVGVPLSVQLTNGDDYAGKTVAQYGKNLFDYTKYPFTNIYIAYQSGYNYESSGSWSGTNDYIPCSHLQGQTITLNHPPLEITSETGAGIAFYTEQSISSYISGVNAYSFTIPVGANYFRFAIPRAYADGTQIQIELGDTVTEYEAYKAPVTATVDESGKAEFSAYATNSVFIMEQTNLQLKVSYEVETAGETFNHTDKIKAITLDRAGENKFFGFGIGQKANVKVIDKDRTCTIAANDSFYISFDGVKVSPKMRVTEVHRDEVSNELSITAYDALGQAAKYTIDTIDLKTFTIGKLAKAIASYLGLDIVLPAVSAFNISYAEGANFDGAETMREVLNAIAEATQTIYYINRNNALVFKRFSEAASADYTIGKEQYFNLESKENRRLAAICNVTELADNTIARATFSGTTQYIRNNPLLELREDLPTLLETAKDENCGLTINQFDCSWRGNYLLEPGDKIALVTKDGKEFYSYLVNDTITYNGAFSQVTNWEFEEEETEHENPTSLGEALKQTYAKVDKANKEIEIVASEVASNKSSIAAIRADTESISASVTSVETKLNDNVETINGQVVELTNKVNATMTSEDIKLEIANELANGAEKVVTSQGYSFDNEGLKVTNSGNNFSTTITENGMQVKEGNKEVLTANNEGVTAVDLHANTFLIIGKYSRFEDYGSKKRTACFWIG